MEVMHGALIRTATIPTGGSSWVERVLAVSARFTPDNQAQIHLIRTLPLGLSSGMPWVDPYCPAAGSTPYETVHTESPYIGNQLQFHKSCCLPDTIGAQK